jgi:CO dehydrogenase maturation factor
MSAVATPSPKPPLWPVDMPLQPRPTAPLWIGVAGKGGAGKSVLAGTLARVLARRGHRVLAIDSDPMPGLAHSLGVAEPDAPLLMQAAEKPEKGPWRLRPGIGPMTAVRRYTTPAPDGVRLLQLGKAGNDGLTPVTGSVNAFLQIVRRMHEAKSLYSWAVIGDLPAGPRHLAAGFSPYAGLYVVVVEPTSQSAMTGRRVARLARGALGADVIFVASKISDREERRRVERLLGEPVDFEVPADPAVADAEARHVAVIDAAPSSPVVRAVQRLADTIELRTLEDR